MPEAPLDRRMSRGVTADPKPRKKTAEARKVRSNRFRGCCFGCGRRGHRVKDCNWFRNPKLDAKVWRKGGFQGCFTGGRKEHLVKDSPVGRSSRKDTKDVGVQTDISQTMNYGPKVEPNQR